MKTSLIKLSINKMNDWLDKCLLGTRTQRLQSFTLFFQSSRSKARTTISVVKLIGRSLSIYFTYIEISLSPHCQYLIRKYKSITNTIDCEKSIKIVKNNGLQFKFCRLYYKEKRSAIHIILCTTHRICMHMNISRILHVYISHRYLSK